MGESPSTMGDPFRAVLVATGSQRRTMSCSLWSIEKQKSNVQE